MALIPRDRLAALLGPRTPDNGDRPARVPYPPLSGVLYAGPNPDGTRKACSNCYKWIVTGQCVEVAGEINPTQVCGYHVFGKPQVSTPLMRSDTELIMPGMTAEEAGLIETPGGEGTSCELCRFFTPDGQDPMLGLCNAVGSVDGLPPVVVDAFGCCARWERGGRPTAGISKAFRAADAVTTNGKAFNGGDRSA